VSRTLDRFFNKKAAKKRRAHRLPVAPAVPRLRVLLIVVGVVFSLAAGRAVQVQAIDASTVADKAAYQRTITRALPAIRGTITDRDGELLAYTQDTVRVIASPKMISTNGRMSAPMTAKDREVAAAAPARLAALLAQYLGGTAEDYLPKLTATGGQQVMASAVPAATYRTLSQAVSDAGLVGISDEPVFTRTYPNGSLAANVLGYVNTEGVGAAGLEYVLNKSLTGTAGKEVYEGSAAGEKIPMGNNTVVAAVNGISQTLTLDAGLQWSAEQIVADQLRRTGADWGGVLVLDRSTGEVLTMAVSPSYDPNQYSKADPANLGNRAVTASYTPGSVQKLLTFAALVDQGLVDPDEVITVPSKIKSGDHVVRDAWDHGTIKLRARGVVAKSSNIGTIIAARRATKQSLHDYMVSFGMGAKTKVGLPGEATGTIPDADMPDYARDGQAFGGSAVTTTMVQMAAAVSVIANGGVYNPPQLVKSQTLPDGTVQEVSTGKSHRVISEDTAAKMLSMMEAMAQNSPSHQFDVPGYRVGAKTGTSKKYNAKCGCFRGLVTSAISVAPIENPRFVVYAVFDSPRRGGSGSAVAGPVVQKVMALALARYAVPQSTTSAPKLPIEP
jgi:cell division protein FtsI (penicillin-binding protein 3)